MTRSLSLSLLLACLSLPLFAQNQPPALARDAAHCLVTDDSHSWLDSQTLSAPELNIALHEDTKTTLGDKYLYLVVYTNPQRNQGRIFDIRIKRHHTYSIENTATFASSPTGVTFSTPPIGGQWEQNQFIPAIQQIMKHRKWYAADMKYLRKPSKSIQCESTMDASNSPVQK